MQEYMRKRRYAFRGMGGKFELIKRNGLSFIGLTYKKVLLNTFMLNETSDGFAITKKRIDDVLEALITLERYGLIS